MGNLSSTLDYRSIVNEIKFGADLTLADVNDENYYGFLGNTNTAAATNPPPAGGDAGSGDYSPPVAADSAPPGNTRYKVTGETSYYTARFFAKDRPIWRTLFLTEMTDEEVASFFNYEDIRYLRMYRPQNLAVILYKCIEQVASFVSSQNYPDNEGNISNHAPSDYTSVLNAVRMLSAAFPYLFEELSNVEAHSPIYQQTVTVHPLSDPRCAEGAHTVGDVNSNEGFVTKDFREADAKWRRKGVSPFAAEFAHHFLFKNRVCFEPTNGDVGTCANELFTMCPTFPPIALRGAGVANSNAPIVVVVIKALTKLCFIPYFSVGGAQRLNSAAAYFAPRASSLPDATVGDAVHGRLLWLGSGPFDGGERVGGGSIAEEAVTRRCLVLKSLVSLLSEPFMRLTPLPTEIGLPPQTIAQVNGRNAVMQRIMALFTSPTVNPLGPTLAASLVEVITHHNSRGTLPFTSGIGATVPESQLALSLQVMSLCLDYYYTYDGTGNNDQPSSLFNRVVPADLVEGSISDTTNALRIRRLECNSFHAILHELAATSPYAPFVELPADEVPHNPPPAHANFARQFVAGIVRILENPSYALSGTVIQGSQKTISCYTEALHLLYRIVLHVPALRDCFFVTTTTSPYQSPGAIPSHVGIGRAPPSPLTEAGAPGTLLQSLWHFIEMGSITYLYFSQMATVLNILLHCFESKVFREFLFQRRSMEDIEVVTRSYLTVGFGVKFFAKPKTIQLSAQLPPVAVLPRSDPNFVSGSGTFADGLALGMCFLLSAAAPRWCYFLTPHIATILRNTLITSASRGKIHDTVQFELRHSLAFLCEDNFLKKGSTALETTTIVASAVFDLIQLHVFGEDESVGRTAANVVVLATALSTCTSFADWLDQLVADGIEFSRKGNAVAEQLAQQGDAEEAATELAPISNSPSGGPTYKATLDKALPVAKKLHLLFGTVSGGPKSGIIYEAVQKHLERSKGKQMQRHQGASKEEWDLSDAELRELFPVVIRVLAESVNHPALNNGGAMGPAFLSSVHLRLPGSQIDGAVSSASNWECLWGTHALWRAIHALNRPMMFEMSTSSITIAREEARQRAVGGQK